ncbi:MAG: pro-sigmaK processing inhibitor BofA family protein [bacterium]
MNRIAIAVMRKFVLAFILLYTLNVLLININIFVPINIYTLFVSTILGPFGAFSLVIISYMII